MIHIRKAEPRDHDKIWNIIQAVIAKGDTFAFDPATSREKMFAFWFGPDSHPYVACTDDEVVGTFMIKPNQPGLGSHIANGAYMTSPETRGKGIGKAMGEFSITEAKRLGFRAMQFNIVVKSNTHAVELWQKLGFKIMCEIPEAFNHKVHGFTNAYVMYQSLV